MGLVQWKLSDFENWAKRTILSEAYAEKTQWDPKHRQDQNEVVSFRCRLTRK